MEKRKIYEAPAMEVVEMRTRESLLTGSDLSSKSIEDGDLNDFESGWE